MVKRIQEVLYSRRVEFLEKRIYEILAKKKKDWVLRSLNILWKKTQRYKLYLFSLSHLPVTDFFLHKIIFLENLSSNTLNM